MIGGINEIRSSLRGRFKDDLLRPGSVGYEDARAIWDGMISKKPGLIARRAGVGDVQVAVRAASDCKILTAVRCGGHFSNLDNRTIDQLLDAAASIPSAQTQIELAYLGGAGSRVSASETAFGDRSAPFIMNLLANWSDASADGRSRQGDLKDAL